MNHGLKKIVSIAIAFSALTHGMALAAGGLPGPSPTPAPPPPPAIIRTSLQGSLDLGDLGYNWSNEINIEGTEQLVFKWSTMDGGAVKGRWFVKDANGVELASAVVPAPPSFQERLFFVGFAALPEREEYRVHVQPLDTFEVPVGLASAAVILNVVEPGPPTQFTDKGLGLPITDQLEAIRQKWNVPALGGVVVTEQGIDAIGVVGIRKHGSSVAAEENDAFHLGSDTKSMTATLIGILAQKGVVPWTLSIEEAFPEWAAQMDNEFADVTLEHLVAHRSGILLTDPEEDSALWQSGLTEPQRRREYTRRIVTRAPLGIPGVTFKYQNGNFIIAGAMLEAMTGKSWETLMQEELFGPLGMTTAGFGAPGTVNQVNQPWGHSDSTGTRVPNQGDNVAALGPAGTVHASLRDWAKYIRLHLTGSEGGVELHFGTRNKLHTEWPTNSVWNQRYGWGWVMFDAFGGQALWHNGSQGSWFSLAQVFPEQGFALLAVTNIGGNNDTPGQFDHGNGDMAVAEVVNMLMARELEGSSAVGVSPGSSIGPVAETRDTADTNSDGVADMQQCGDPNGSGAYESEDLQLLYNCLRFDPTATGECAGVIQNGDTNASGRFESDDLFRAYGALQSQGSAAPSGPTLSCPASSMQ